MSLFLTLERLAEILNTVLAESDGLVAARGLNMLFTEHVPGLVKVTIVGFKSSVKFVDFLVHHAHLGVDAGDLGMVLADAVSEDVECAVQVLETLCEVAYVMVVHG